VTIPRVISVAVPVAMPIPRMPRENVFVPVTTKSILSIPDIICVPNIISISELAPCISLVPHLCGGWISTIRESGHTTSLIRLSDRCHSEWT
jgi:hypothetical protein